MTGIRAASEADVPVIKGLAEVIWPEAYGEIISAAQIKYMLELIYSAEALTAQFAKGHRFLIAEHDHSPIGFAAFSQKSPEESHVFRLHKLYVAPRQHAQGVGGTLLADVISESKKAGATQLELNVNKYNPSKAFYDKKGFAVLRDEVIDIGEGFVMDDYVMVKDI